MQLQYNDLTQRIYGTTRSDEDIRGSNRLDLRVASFPSLPIVQFLTTFSTLKTQSDQKWTVGRPGNNTNLQRMQ